MKTNTNTTTNGRLQALTVDRLAVIIVCNAARRQNCIRTIVACTQHFDPEQVHVVDYGLAAASDALLEETLAELDLHTVHYSYMARTTDQWCAAAAACHLFCQRYTHILLVDPMAAQRPTHLQRGLEHFAKQSTFSVVKSSPPPRSKSPFSLQRFSSANNNNNNRLQSWRESSSSSSSSGEMMRLTGGNYQFQFNLWDRRKLLAYLREYEDCLENDRDGNGRSFLPTRDYAPIDFY